MGKVLFGLILSVMLTRPSEEAVWADVPSQGPCMPT